MKHIIFLLAVIVVACNSQPSKKVSDSSASDSNATELVEKGQVEKNNFCNELAEEILKSSPRYKKLTEGLTQAVKRNGGTSVSITMEKSPDASGNNLQEHSASYEMQLTENYPDRQVSIARFVFDPAKTQLYEYDIIADSLKSIPFDQALLNNAQDYCK